MTVKVLAARAGDWCNSENKPMDTYNLVPLEYIGRVYSLDAMKGRLEEMIPKDAEVVTDYSPSFSFQKCSPYTADCFHICLLATALVPRNKAGEAGDRDK